MFPGFEVGQVGGVPRVVGTDHDEPVADRAVRAGDLGRRPDPQPVLSDAGHIRVRLGHGISSTTSITPGSSRSGAFAFDPSEARDDHGRWSDGGGDGPSPSTEAVKAVAKGYQGAAHDIATNETTALAWCKDSLSGTFGKLHTDAADVAAVASHYGTTFDGTIKDAAGKEVGAWSVNFYPKTENRDEDQLWIGLVKLNPEVQGGGFAREFLANMEDKARNAGFGSLGLEADTDVGGYTWAALGFSGRINGDIYNRMDGFANHGWLSDDKGHRFDGGHPEMFDDQVKDQAVNLLRSNATPQGVMQLGNDSGHSWEGGTAGRMWPGKAMLLGTSWYGRKPL